MEGHRHVGRRVVSQGHLPGREPDQVLAAAYAALRTFRSGMSRPESITQGPTELVTSSHKQEESR